MITKTILTALISLLVLMTIIFQACKKDEEESNKAPSCEITSPSAGEDFMENEIVTITVIAADSDGSITEVRFYIDGVSKASVNNSPYSCDWNTNGESLGNHILKAISVDNNGASATDEVTIAIIVASNIPVSDFTATPTSGGVPLTVNFTDQSTNNPTSWEWDFGDGNNSNEQNPSHVYNDMGVYDITLTVANDDGSDTKTGSNFIIAKDVFTDSRDGQNYYIITIGDQTWFAENLNYEATDSWWYKDDEANGNIYGRLYTWDAATMACPGGWHLPADDEWKTLEMFLGMSQSDADAIGMRGANEGERLKSLSGWNSGTGTDQYGFAALPSGERDQNGNFLYKGDFTALWTATPHAEYEIAWYRFMDGGEDRVGREESNKLYGYSVRCIKND
ncbi:MAG: hypothetical protein C0591_00455 [Marinilabiliales bacterium]|nr:MAG: hypothetical protein C0591_00455 [Marinilabiliales bacterium]